MSKYVKNYIIPFHALKKIKEKSRILSLKLNIIHFAPVSQSNCVNVSCDQKAKVQKCGQTVA